MKKTNVFFVFVMGFVSLILILNPIMANAKVKETPFYSNANWKSAPQLFTDINNNVYALDGNVEAISPAGKKKWQYEPGYKELSGFASDKKGNLYVGCFLYVRSLTSNGKVRWSYNHYREGIDNPVVTPSGNIMFAEFGNYNDPDPDNWYHDLKTVQLNSVTGKRFWETVNPTVKEGKDFNYYMLSGSKVISTDRAGKTRWTHAGTFSNFKD